MNVVDLVALVLASGGLVDCYFNGSIFARQREHAEEREWTLFMCDYCMNYQAPFWLLLFFYTPSLFLPPPWLWIPRLPIYFLAAAYAAWLINEWRARHDCDYARTRRQEHGDEDYGSFGSQHMQAGTTAATHVLSRVIPTLLVHDQPPLYFCDNACRMAYMCDCSATAVIGPAESGTCPEGTTCAQCGTSLMARPSTLTEEDYA